MQYNILITCLHFAIDCTCTAIANSRCTEATVSARSVFATCMALCVAVFTIIIIIVQIKANRRIHNNSASAIAETPMYEDVKHQLSKDSVTDTANKNIPKSLFH